MFIALVILVGIWDLYLLVKGHSDELIKDIVLERLKTIRGWIGIVAFVVLLIVGITSFSESVLGGILCLEVGLWALLMCLIY